MQRAKTIGRWVVVFPGGILVAVLALFPVHWIILLMHAYVGEDDSLSIWNMNPDTLERLAAAFVTPYVTIWAGTWIAPTRKIWTSRILAVVLIASIALMHGYFLGSSQEYVYSGLNGLQNFLAIALNLAGVVVALRSVEADDPGAASTFRWPEPAPQQTDPWPSPPPRR